MNGITEITKKMLVLILIISALLMSGAMPVTAYNANLPATYTVNYIIPSDTTFAVTLAGAEITMDFNPTTKDSKEVQPDSQNDGAATPWATIANNGNVAQNIRVNVTASNPSWVSVNISNTTTYAANISLDTTLQSPTGWTAIAAGDEVRLYARASFLDAVSGTTPRTLTINTTSV